jgi:hypothetical protein
LVPVGPVVKVSVPEVPRANPELIPPTDALEVPVPVIVTLELEGFTPIFAMVVIELPAKTGVEHSRTTPITKHLRMVFSVAREELTIFPTRNAVDH